MVTFTFKILTKILVDLAGRSRLLAAALILFARISNDTLAQLGNWHSVSVPCPLDCFLDDIDHSGNANNHHRAIPEVSCKFIASYLEGTIVQNLCKKVERLRLVCEVHPSGV